MEFRILNKTEAKRKAIHDSIEATEAEYAKKSVDYEMCIALTNGDTEDGYAKQAEAFSKRMNELEKHHAQFLEQLDKLNA